MLRIGFLLSCAAASWSLSLIIPPLVPLSDLQRVLDVSSDEFRARAPYAQCQAHITGTLIAVNFQNEVESTPRTIDDAYDEDMDWEAGE